MSYPRIDLDGAVVAITGGARGIGKATADLFAANGATVCTGDLDGGTYIVDVTSRDSFALFVGDVIDRFGRIDVLVNNAGVMPLGDFLSEDNAISATTLDVNVWGLIHGMQLVMPHMIERGSGHVVNVASMAGKLAIPGMAVYNASKFAAVGLSAAVRRFVVPRMTDVSEDGVCRWEERTRWSGFSSSKTIRGRSSSIGTGSTSSATKSRWPRTGRSASWRPGPRSSISSSSTSDWGPGSTVTRSAAA